MEVRWFKSDFSAPVHLYTAGRDQPTVQDAAYKGRTELYREEFPRGNASLKLKNVNAHDSGEYRCFIDYKDDYDETKILLTVGGVGQQPWIDLEGTYHHGVRLVCKSDGWYPVPTVYRLNGNEENVTRQSVTTRKDQSSGLFAVFSQIDVTSDSVNKYSCIMRNNVLNEEKMAQIQLSVSVTLDGETANPKLGLKNQNSVKLTEAEQNCPDTGKCFTELESVLGLDEFQSGRYYWVVEVGMNRNWSLGVATETAERNGSVELTPENGFWTIGRVGDEFHANDSTPIALSTRRVPENLGIYLSYESGIISFHSLPTKTCVHTFTVDKFEGKLYPFISTSHVDNWVKVSSGSVLDLHKEPRSRGTLRNRFRRLWSGKPY
ncbi:butyrophilin subfamily 1 member A1-like [Mobula hypostoma]|uniref:butyrophilin subfamily 1 member A1-like n=1 Tax=Mobula hypostoma TaxID=723540 RepID=UPI002FC2C5D4